MTLRIFCNLEVASNGRPHNYSFIQCYLSFCEYILYLEVCSLSENSELWTRVRAANNSGRDIEEEKRFAAEELVPTRRLPCHSKPIDKIAENLSEYLRIGIIPYHFINIARKIGSTVKIGMPGT